MMNEIYHFVIWGFKRLNIYHVMYFIGTMFIAGGIVGNNNTVLLIGAIIMSYFAIHLCILMPLKYYFEKFRKEKEDTFNILKGDKYSNGE